MKTTSSSRNAQSLIRLSVFLIIAALIAATAGCSGGGSPLPPSKDLEIRTWYDLDAVRDNLEGNHLLMNDLDSTTAGYQELASPTANGGKGWEPIGIYHPNEPTASTGFMGTFDGQGHEICDLYINRPDEHSVGLFKTVDHGVIENVGVTNVTVIGRDSVGGLAGGIYDDTVSKSYSSGSVTGNDYVGGMAGRARCIVADSCFNGTVTGHEYVGGLAGIIWRETTISSSYFTGNVAGTLSVGGLVGANYEGTLSDSYTTGSVTGYESVGGLVGLMAGTDPGGTVSDSYSAASVTGEAGVGGLVGDNHWVHESLAEDPYHINLWPGVWPGGFDVHNSYYDYDVSLINGKNVITIGALSGEDFDQWLANHKFLDINERLSQEDGYYLINNVSDFKQLLAFGQNDTLKFRLTSDLNLATEPGLYIPYLTGEFDGNGHKISNLSFNAGFVCNVGLFGYLGLAGEVTHVGVENINITGAGSVGGLVGQSYGTVSDSCSSGTVTGEKLDVGGLVGSNIHGSWRIGGQEWNSAGTINDSFSTAGVSGGYVVGGLVGSNFFGIVSGSYSTGSVTGNQYVGGLVGISDVGLGDTGNLSNSYSTGSVTGNQYVGGLAGFGVGSNSYYNYDDVLINGEHVITAGALSGGDFDQWLANDKFLDVNGRLSQEGGYYLINDVNDLRQLLAVGHNASLKFRLTNDLDLATEPNFYIPYLAGEFDGNGHRISNLSFEFDFASYVGLFGFLAPGGNITQLADENVNVTGLYYVGGLVGFSTGSVSRSYSTGSVSGKKSVGGLVGYNLGTVSNSHSATGVTGDQRVGGLVGWNDYGSDLEDTDGIVSKSYSTGSVTGNWGVGGLVGHSDEGQVTNSFWDTETSGQATSAGGTGKTTAQMKDITTFLPSGWNIVAVAGSSERNPAYIWNIVADVTYPFLSWQAV